MLLRPVQRGSALFVAGYLGNAARLLRILDLFLATGLFFAICISFLAVFNVLPIKFSVKRVRLAALRQGAKP